MSKVLELKVQLESAVNLLNEIQSEDNNGELPHRVIHVKNNPVQLEMNASKRRFEELKKDNERLKARLELLESGNSSDITRRIDDVVNSSQQIESLSKQLDELRKREAKILDSFRKTSREFREVCYLLTGWRVEGYKDRIYRLSNMYAESENDKLFFEIAPDGTIQLLKNGYSDQLSEYINTYLENADSFPAFLSSITADLFKSSTQLTPMSMCMSTTIQPNPNYHPDQ